MAIEPRAAVQDRLHIPALVIPPSPPKDLATVGMPDVQLDGAPFPWATVGEWKLTFGDDSFATLHLSIPVRLAAADE